MSRARLPVARPLLVPSESLAPYLREIDESRIYSNFGPLGRRFEKRLSERLKTPFGGIVPVANATLGLAGALLEIRRPGRTLCVVPAWTFCASAHAVIAAGLQPFFVDVDPKTWQLTPAFITALPEGVLDRVAAVMPVGAFGAWVDGRRWDEFTAVTGIPVVIDAAAGFDSLVPTATPVVVSLHATKSLGIGEGGFVATTDAELGMGIRQRINFGFRGTRSATMAGINAKLSEYASAVGLASLDVWEQTRAKWAHLRDVYWSQFRLAAPGWFTTAPAQAWVSATFVVATRSDFPQVRNALDVDGIDSRRWWEAGCHREAAFAGFRSTPTPTTDYLAAHTIGLPFFSDMSTVEINRVVKAITPHIGNGDANSYAVYPVGDLVKGSAS